MSASSAQPRPAPAPPSRRRSLCRFAVLAAAMAAALPAMAEEAVPGVDPATGLRMGQYRAPTPPSVPGAATLGVAAVQDARKAGAVLIDVMAQQGGGADPATGQWRIQKPRDHIPGSVWLPDVGMGALTPRMDLYWRQSLERLAGPPPGKAVVFYCLADCWMSWNASRRAVRMGYAQVGWFPAGTDGWSEAGLPLVPADPPPPVPVGDP